MNPQQPYQPQPVQPEPPRPVAYDANNQPLYAAAQVGELQQAAAPISQPQVPPAPQPQPMPAQPAQSVQPVAPQPDTSFVAQPQPAVQSQGYAPASHVTAAPMQYEGQNFDPRARVQYANEPEVVHHHRPYEPRVDEMSEELKLKHEKSKRMYPNLNLSEGEFVVMNIKRHLIGLLLPTGVTIAVIVLLMAALLIYPSMAVDASGTVPGIATVTTILLGLIVLVGIFGYIAVWVYLQNTFYLTNESVIQEIQHGIFSKHEQTVSLGSIEDASFKQFGIWQSLFNYGTIRLSTEGEETTYRFQYVSEPKKQIAILNNAIESFKNGRPVTAINEDEN